MTSCFLNVFGVFTFRLAVHYRTIDWPNKHPKFVLNFFFIFAFFIKRQIERQRLRCLDEYIAIIIRFTYNAMRSRRYVKIYIAPVCLLIYQCFYAFTPPGINVISLTPRSPTNQWLVCVFIYTDFGLLSV